MFLYFLVFYNEWLPNYNAYGSSDLYHARIRQYHRPVRQSFFPAEKNRSQNATEIYNNVNEEKIHKFPFLLSRMYLMFFRSYYVVHFSEIRIINNFIIRNMYN